MTDPRATLLLLFTFLLLVGLGIAAVSRRHAPRRAAWEGLAIAALSLVGLLAVLWHQGRVPSLG